MNLTKQRRLLRARPRRYGRALSRIGNGVRRMLCPPPAAWFSLFSKPEGV